MSKDRRRITRKDAEYLAFIGKFPGSDAEALSYLTINDRPRFNGVQAGQLTSPATIEKRMRRLEQMGNITSYRHQSSGLTYYALTALGAENVHYWQPLTRIPPLSRGIAPSRLEHYRNCALIAAQLASPAAPLKDKTGLDPLPLNLIYSENETRQAYDRRARHIKNARNSGKNTEAFADHRITTARRDTARIAEGSLNPAHALENDPSLFTIATNHQSGDTFRKLKQPDIALHLDPLDRTPDDPTPKNILVEVEITAKEVKEYEAILRILDHELRENVAYDQILYFVGSPSISQRIKQATKETGLTRLLTTGSMSILHINGRTEHPAVQTPRKVLTLTPNTAKPLQDVSEFFTDED